MSIDKKEDHLRSLLAELPKLRDDGFTDRVLYRVQLRALRRRSIYFTACCCGIVAIVISLALGRFGTSLNTRVQDSTSAWADFANLSQISQSLTTHLQLSNFNTVIGLSAGALILVLGISSLLRD